MIITPIKIYDPNDEYDEEYFEFGLFMSRREYKTIKRRMQRGRVAAGGIQFNACVFQVKGDPITDLTEDLATEQKARSTYDNILRLIHDPEICDPIRFLRQREIVHFQRFGEALVHVQDDLPKNVYAYNPAFDEPKRC